MNPEKYTREYKNAWLRKWRQEHPARAKYHAKKNRETMKKNHPGYYQEYSQKWKREHPTQRKAVDDALNSSRKLNAVCSKCGSAKNIERHHPDYSKPLEFVILCRKCHRALHNKPVGDILEKAGFEPKPHLCKLPIEKRTAQTEASKC